MKTQFNAISALFIFFSILSLPCKSAAVATQRLYVPAMGVTHSDSKGTISVPAYCVDATLHWPERGHQLPYVYFGDKSPLTLLVNGKTTTLSLEQALKLKYVKVISAVRSVEIVRANQNVRIKSIELSEGLGIGEQDEKGMVPINKEIFSYVPPDIDPDGWFKRQRILHFRLSQYEAQNPEIKTQRINEFIESSIKQNKLFKKNKNWEVRNINDKIVIHERKTNRNGGGLPPPPKDRSSSFFDNLYNELQVNKNLEGGDLSVCLEIDGADSSASIKISGALKLFIPLEIVFTSDGHISVEAELFETEIKNSKGQPKYNVALSVSSDISSQKKTEKLCRISQSINLCYPPEASSIEFEACGKTISASITYIKFAF